MARESFEIVRKGYDPQMVDRELRELNSEITRQIEQNQKLTEQLRQLRRQLNDSEAALNAAGNPNYAALGSKAATILSTAQQIAGELEVNAKQIAANIVADAELKSTQLKTESDARYREVVAEGERRVQRRLNEAQIEAERILREARAEAEQLVKIAESDAGRARGSAATEVAAMRATAKREIEQLRSSVELRIAQQLDEAASTKMTKLEAALKARRAEAEAEYLEKHREAVELTEQYLTNANAELAKLQGRIRDAELEAETLELAAASSQQRMLNDARERAEGLIHAAEVEAREVLERGTTSARETELKASKNLVILQNQADAIEIYLENLRSLVTGELSKRGNDERTS